MPAETGMERAFSKLLDYVLQKDSQANSHILAELARINERLNAMSAQLDALEAAVKRETDVGDSVVILLKGIATELAASRQDPVKVQALIDTINQKADAWSTAVTENTPAA